MADGVIRLEATRDLPDRALVKHVLGLQRPASALVRRNIGVGVVRICDGDDGAATRELTRADLREFRATERLAAQTAAAQRGGKRPSLAISWLLAGGPDTDDVHRDASTIPADAPATLAEGRPWTVADCVEFGLAGHDLLREALPTARWLGALHLDEKAVHYQAEMPAVLVDEAGHARVGNAGIRESLARLAPDFAAENARIYEQLRRREAAAEKREASARAAGRTPKKRRRWIDKGADHVYLAAEAQMRMVHDLYAERFAHFGIVRGKGGKKQHHERVDRGKGLEGKLRAIEREVAEAERDERERAQDAQRKLEAAKGDADRLSADRDKYRQECQQLATRVTGLRTTADELNDKVHQLAEQRAAATREVEAELKAAGEARECRQEEEEIGRSTIGDWLSRRGRQVVAGLEQARDEAQRALAATVKQLKEQIGQLRAQRDAARKQRDAARQELDQARQELDRVPQTLAEASREEQRTAASQQRTAASRHEGELQRARSAAGDVLHEVMRVLYPVQERQPPIARRLTAALRSGQTTAIDQVCGEADQINGERALQAAQRPEEIRQPARKEPRRAAGSGRARD